LKKVGKEQGVCVEDVRTNRTWSQLWGGGVGGGSGKGFFERNCKVLLI